jgi:hypothetical protein
MLDLETVIKAGAILPSTKALEAAIVWAIQLEKCHLRSEIFQKILFFLNRVEFNQGQPAKYLPTWEQFLSVINSLVEQEILVDKSGKLFHHPQIQKLIDSDQPKPRKQKKKKWRK